jgi:hypothetical protein
MKKILFSILALSTFCSVSALAQNLGQISSDQRPQGLKPAESFVKYANTREPVSHTSTSSANVTDTARSQRGHDNLDDRDDFLFGLGGLGLGAWDLSLGWGLWPYTSSYFPYYSYYYPYYYGSYYYPYSYGRYYYPYYWSQPNDNQQPRPTERGESTHQSVATDRAHTPVVCFTSDEAGNWYGEVDTAANAVKTQSALNQECTNSGTGCHLNLGCALATSATNHE